MVWCAIIWFLWKTRNECIFKNITFDVTKVLDEIDFLAWSRLKSRIKSFDYSFTMWSLNHAVCILDESMARLGGCKV